MTPATSQVDTHQSYDPAYFERLFAVEDRHFWFRARNQVLTTVMRQITSGLTPGYRVLEVGCGTGNVLRMLSSVCEHGIVFGMDLYAEGLQYARQRTPCPLVQGDVYASPFSQPFQLLGLFDVLEHLPDDMTILHALHALLAPGGHLILTVPAYQSLWSYFDEASHHCRRYELPELESKLQRAGYRIEFATAFMASLFPLVWMGRRLSALLDRRRHGAAASHDDLAMRELRIIPVVNEMLLFMLKQEARWIARRRRLPIGTSLLVITRKV